MPAELSEIADRVWVARHDWLDVNVTVVAGDRGVLVIDTLGSTAEMRHMLEAVRALDAGPVVAAVNTHEHFDHVLGNAELGDVPIHSHEETAAALVRFRNDRPTHDGPRAAEVDASPVVVPQHTLSSARVIDLGGRVVELVHPGRGHTAGDVVVRVEDANVLVAGDLVEESAPPSYGPDSHPLAWPTSLDLVLSLTTPATAVVPGHGAVTDRDFMEEQRNDIGVVAETIRDLASSGVPATEALVRGTWPFPEETLTEAVRRGYAQLPRSAKRLPLI